MNNKEVFNAFEKIGCVVFTTMDGQYPSSRIAHFLTYDDDGLYFFTMRSKPFYKQLKETAKISVCGLCADSEVKWVDKNIPVSEPGYFIRLKGDVREFTIDDAIAKNDPRFDYLIYDNKKYPMITGFCIYNYNGEIYDYDFEKENREHKLQRQRFAFGSMKIESVGLSIDESKCIFCGKCEKACSFSAIYKSDSSYQINGKRCDECGNCFSVCPVGAVAHKGK